MNAILDAFARMSPGEALIWMLVENLALFTFALGAGQLLIVAYRSRLVGPRPPPVEAAEVTLALSCVGLNTLITLAGWYLWRGGYIVVRRDAGLWTAIDVVVLLLTMDLAMYVLHRLAHLRWIYLLSGEGGKCLPGRPYPALGSFYRLFAEFKVPNTL